MRINKNKALDYTIDIAGAIFSISVLVLLAHVLYHLMEFIFEIIWALFFGIK